MTKKLLLTAIALSLFGHLLFLGISGFINLSGPAKGEESLTLYLGEEPPDPPRKEEKSPQEQPMDRTTGGISPREDTVTLSGGESKYRDYLLKVKRDIEAHWTYPREALEAGTAGTVVLQFAIAADGKLAENRVLESSGEEVLDQEALQVIRAAAPYEPLPRAFQLARLNVIARFEYELASL